MSKRSIEKTYDNMIDIIIAFKYNKRLQKRAIISDDNSWEITNDPIPDFINYQYRIYDETPKPAIVGLFFDGHKYFPKLITVESETPDAKELFDNLIIETVKNDPSFRKWITDKFYYNT